jgi:putative redox protein
MAELKATVHYGENDFFIGISPAGHAQIMETNGERGLAATPIELLPVAVGGCMGSDVIDILRKKREQVTDIGSKCEANARMTFRAASRKSNCITLSKGILSLRIQ